MMADTRSEPREAGELALAVLDSLVDAVYVVDRNWTITFANQGFVRHMDIPRLELVGRTIWDVVSTGQEDRLRDVLERVVTSRNTTARPSKTGSTRTSTVRPV